MMKIILSRKGFDSTSGGCPNPILSDNTLLSLPIPDDTPPIPNNAVTFSDLYYGDYSYAEILKGLRPNKLFRNCHLDPDIRKVVRKEAVMGWNAAFGQTGSALGVLRNAGVEVGDLFLFFGLFRSTEIVNDSMRYVRNKKPVHVIYGYMQIGKILDNPDDISEFYWHPHSNVQRYNKNSLYLPSDKLSINPSLPGYGVLSYRPNRVLTMQGAKPATWELHDFLAPDNVIGNRKNNSKTGGLYYAGQWQELVLKPNKDAIEWAKGLLQPD